MYVCLRCVFSWRRSRRKSSCWRSWRSYRLETRRPRLQSHQPLHMQLQTEPVWSGGAGLKAGHTPCTCSLIGLFSIQLKTANYFLFAAEMHPGKCSVRVHWCIYEKPLLFLKEQFYHLFWKCQNVPLNPYLSVTALLLCNTDAATATDSVYRELQCYFQNKSLMLHCTATFDCNKLMWESLVFRVIPTRNSPEAPPTWIRPTSWYVTFSLYQL